MLLALLIVLPCVLATGARSGVAHPNKLPPPVDIICVVLSPKIEVTLSVNVPLMDAWLRAEKGMSDPQAASDPQVEAFLRETLTLSFEGRAVALEMSRRERLAGYINPGTGDQIPATWLIQLKGDVPFASPPAAAAGEVPRLPTHAKLTWSRFEGVDWEGDNEVPGRIDAQEGEHYVGIASALLTPAEPELHWHRSESHRFQFQTVQVEAGEKPTFIHLPLVGLLLILISIWLMDRLHGVAPLVRAAPVALALVLGFLARDVVIYTFAVPGTGTEVLPTPTKGKAIFQQLQDNIYAAFRQNDESVAYDLIAASVEAPLVRPLYSQIHRHLIMQGQSGVLTRVTEVEHIDGEVYLPRDSWARHFRVEWHWRATGVFAHQGHMHTRINEYKAEYVLRESGGSWKIAQIDVHEHRRRDDDQPIERLDPETGLVLPSTTNYLDALRITVDEEEVGGDEDDVEGARSDAPKPNEAAPGGSDTVPDGAR